MAELKETDSSLRESESELNNESEDNLMGFECFKFINDYTPFKFNERLLSKNKEKYFAFSICKDSSENMNIKKDNQNVSSFIEEKSNKKDNNIKMNIKKENLMNNNNSYNQFYERTFPNLCDGLDDMREVDEGEIESEENNENEEGESEEFEEDFQDFEDDLGIRNFDIRNDSSIKIVVVNIIETYNKIKPNFYSLINNKQEEEKVILTDPSEPKVINGKDNINGDLIVRKYDEIKNDKNTYIIIDLLGTGISGQTFKALCQNDNKYYALKIIKSDNPMLTKACIEEYKILKKLNDLDKNNQYHIIHSYDSFVFNNHLCIVNELMQKTLLEILKANNSNGLSLTSIRFISRQILKAIDFIHSCKIIHTDLKPENILLSIQNENNNLNTTEEKSQNTELVDNKVLIKIADFGSACKPNELIRKQYIQSMYYRAPEVIIGLTLNEKVDVWSIGCILIELYLKTPILPGTSSYDQLYKINTLIGEYPQYLIDICRKRTKYFIKDKVSSYYRIKTPKEYYTEFPKDKPKDFYQIPEKMKSIDDLINVKKDTIKMKNSRMKSTGNSFMSVNSSNVKDDIVSFIHLLKCMLQIDPNKRWSCKKCLTHPFIKGGELVKFIRGEINDNNPYISNSFNYNNKSNIQNNYRSQINKSFNNNYNINNFGGKLNYSFGNFNNNNLNFRKIIQNNQRYSNSNNQINRIPENNKNNQYNINQKFNQNVNYNNYNNQKLNSFSYNIYPNNFEQNQGMSQVNIFPINYPIQNYFYNPNSNIYYYNNPYNRQNKTFLGIPHQNLNSSYNNYNGPNYIQDFQNRQNFDMNKQYNKNEFFFNKNNILNNIDENRKDNHYNNNYININEYKNNMNQNKNFNQEGKVNNYQNKFNFDNINPEVDKKDEK